MFSSMGGAGGRVMVLCVLLAALASCDRPLESLEGTVVDSRTGDALADVEVSAGGQTATTDKDGRFVLREVDQTATITATICGYEDATAELPDDGSEVTLEAEAIRTTGRVTSNLTGDGLRATVRSGDIRARASKDGRFTLRAVCNERMRVATEGYGSEVVRLDGSAGSVEVELQAGPAETIRQQIEWEANGLLAREWALVHPDARSYVTKDQWIREVRLNESEGYPYVSVDVKDVRIIRWVFPACSLDDFGPKTYPRTAALRVVYHQAQPSGGLYDQPGLAHLVKDKDGLWKWFPNLGCDSPLSA